MEYDDVADSTRCMFRGLLSATDGSRVQRGFCICLQVVLAAINAPRARARERKLGAPYGANAGDGQPLLQQQPIAVDSPSAVEPPVEGRKLGEFCM